jgi:hypothetical protein
MFSAKYAADAWRVTTGWSRPGEGTCSDGIVMLRAMMRKVMTFAHVTATTPGSTGENFIHVE